MEESPLEDANEEIAEEDLEALESEIALAVLLDTNVPRHPVQVGSKNICELSRANKFNTLKIAELDMPEPTANSFRVTSKEEIIHRATGSICKNMHMFSMKPKHASVHAYLLKVWWAGSLELSKCVPFF